MCFISCSLFGPLCRLFCYCEIFTEMKIRTLGISRYVFIWFNICLCSCYCKFEKYVCVWQSKILLTFTKSQAEMKQQLHQHQQPQHNPVEQIIVIFRKNSKQLSNINIPFYCDERDTCKKKGWIERQLIRTMSWNADFICL